MIGKRLTAGLLAASMLIIAAAGVVWAHGNDGRYEDRDDDRYENYGHGMGYGMGPGMIGSQGMGPGMMGSQGMRPGMMGSQGMRPGMMGRGPMPGLELNSTQRKQMASIRSNLRKHNWTLQGEMIDAQEKLFELYAEETPDPKKIGAVYAKIFDLKRQMIEAAIDAKNRQRAVLTAEQREQLRNSPFGSRGGMHHHGIMGHEFGHHMMGG